MSYHSQAVRISPSTPETSLQEQSPTAQPAVSPDPASTTKNPKSSGIGRAVQSLLSTPQSARSAGTRAGGAALPSRGRPFRNTAEPLKSSPLRNMASAPSSPERPSVDTDELPRRSSDQFTRTTDLGASTAHVEGLEDASRSDMSLPSEQIASKKREKPQGRKGMAAMMSGLESRLFPRSFSRGRDSSRGSSRRGSSLDSRSPSSASQFGRSVSPGSRQFDSASKPTLADTERGKVIKMDNAHNQSDEALAKPSGRLPDYVKPSNQEESGERLAKDVFDRDKNIIESSEEDGDESSSDDEKLSHARGRKKKGSDITRITPSDFNKPRDDKSHFPEESMQTRRRLCRDTNHLRKKGLIFNAAKSTAKPNIPGMEKRPRKSALKAVIHPRTSYDIPTPYTQSAAGTPYGSEDEAEKEDVHRAQKLSISMSAIDNRVPNRSIRTIVRGDFASLQEEADGGRRRQRKYLVATDLSEESVYALEWTIGAVLREGDTMYAIFTIHEDANPSSVQVGEGAKAMQDAAVVVGSQTREASQNPGTGSRTILGRLGPGTASKAGSVDSRASSMAESERVRAVENVSETCVKLLRKTLLQVRIAVEVIHCKSPKLMITEAIDELEPTMVIVGARGQSALKGVLLGSFSNYLLQNSSVPVMVARRKLKRHPVKGRINSANVHLSNNLRAPKSLTQANVD
ncbi:hypothetical protein N7532_008471 [Penicillium argentinense]|uniref:UspA domain-containing protein n=1 Tax=Penicillium argentinense TaxID=1131581 RepID=A0A9W9EXG3_9EURO|nr:uncharacterized protein N7532_008471 [Penicillium argentinense]KAJ5089787.1 hypothetical protein N7532_008471 [Penicillium argentinense]